MHKLNEKYGPKYMTGNTSKTKKCKQKKIFKDQKQNSEKL
jgi:hypothetical protein